MKDYVWVVERLDPKTKKWEIYECYQNRSGAREETKWGKWGDESEGERTRYRTRKYYSEDSFIGMFR